MKVDKNLATPSHLTEKGRMEVARALNQLVADAFSLYLKTKNFHWHVSGSHFRDYHLLFDEQADQIFAMIDILAERVRKIGFTTVRSTGEVTRLQRIKDNDADFVEPKNMVTILLNDNKDYLEYMKKAHEICNQHNDMGTTSILEVFIDETERRIWFLFETAR